MTIGLSGDNKRIQFALPNVSIAAQLIEANYPDYKQIVPRSHATRAVLETPALLRAIEMAHQVHQQGQLSVTPGTPGQVAIASENPETGDCHVTLDATAQLVLCLDGDATVSTETGSEHLRVGESVFAGVADGPLTIEGSGRVAVGRPAA